MLLLAYTSRCAGCKLDMETKLTPQKALDATKRTQYIDKDVLDTWPETTGTLEYFKLDTYVSAKELDAEYEKRGLLPAPFAMCAADGPIMDEKEYIATQWKDKDGNFCYLIFGGWNCKRGVGCNRYDGDWAGHWWFCGVKKNGAELEERLGNYTEDENGCWNWNGVVSKGYGLIKVHSQSTRVHRLMYEVFVGSIPEGLVIDHLCKNKQCVNPQHLEAVTSRENTLRGSSPIAEQARQDTCKEGHEFSIRADGHRECKTCRKARRKNYD